MATPLADANPLTGIAAIDGLLQGGHWVFAGPPLLTVSLHGNFIADKLGGYVPGNSGAWTPEMTDALTRAMAAWSNVANIHFLPLSSGTFAFESTADIAATLSGNDLQGSGARGLAWFPDPAYVDAALAALGQTRTDYPLAEGDVYFSNFDPAFARLFEGGQGLAIMIHELGHALGLKHPQDDGGHARPTFTELGIASLANANQTIMAGNLGAVSGLDNYAATPMPLDILAIQYLYGANMGYRPGDDTYVQALDGFKKTIWDAGGTDTLDASAVVGGVTLDLRPGAVMFLSQNTVLGLAYGAWLENVIAGAGADTVYGNSLPNTIDGGLGIDTMTGGAGDDVYLVGNSADTVIEEADAGTDTVRSSASFILPAHVENLELTVRGYNPIAGTGNAGNNRLVGNLYENVLSGMEGSDTLLGGAGNDTLLGAVGFDLLDGGEGDDFINGGMNADTLFGGAGHDFLGGGKGLDSVDGGDGNDTLTGGFGNDTLMGGAGADHFRFVHALNAINNVDTITDFTSGVDVMELSATIFAAFSAQVGQRMGVNDTTMLYDGVTGVLAYDADGLGGAAATPFVVIGIATHPGAVGIDFLITP